MSFRDAFRRRTPGYAGGTLEDQLLRDALLQSQEPQVLTPQNQQAITRQRRVTPVPEEVIAPPTSAPSFKARFTQPRPEPFGSSGEPFGSVRQRRTQPRDTISDDSQYLRDLEREPRNWKDKTVDVMDAISAGFGNKPRTTLTKRERQLKQAEDSLGRELVVGQKQAQIAGAQIRPQIQQASLDEREVNNALSQYNRLEHYDPDDPADAAIRKYFESRGLELPKKDKYRRPIVTRTDDGRIIVTGPEGSQDMQVDGQVVADTARQPTETQIGEQTFNIPQKQAAQITAQTTTAAANRAAADTRSRRTQEGQDRRLQRRLDAPAKAGGRQSAPQTKAANALAAKYNYLRKAEMSTDIDPKQKPEIQRQREAVWQQIMDTYPGMFEADEKTFELRPKVGAQESAPARGGKLNEATVRQAAMDAGLDPDEAVRRAKAKGRL